MSVKKFKFRLEKFLSIKKQEEKQLQGEFFKLKNELYDIEKKIEKKNKEIEESFSLLRSEVMGNITFIEKWQRYISLLKLEKRELENLKEQKNIEVENKMAELLNKIKERKSVEILREKKFEAYLKELNKEEQNFIDEINTSRFKREK
jgi:flagellar FliJ protein